jgi:Ca-activated chloride channel family protein
MVITRPTRFLGPALTTLLLIATASTRAQQVRVETGLDHTVLKANTKQLVYLRVALTGFDAPAEKVRAPLNVAIVIDKSGSMKGDKIGRAKEAAKAALAQMRDDDIVSIVAYDGTVEVLVPATKVSDRDVILRGIDRLDAGGMTALFGGVVKGASEVRKFLAKERVNRVILLSDGVANVGPSSPRDLAQLGATLGREGIAVTTVGLGLGYNEDLMVELAQGSGGQHVFIEHERQLAQVFKEGFGNLASIVAKEVVVKIRLSPEFRPVRVLGREADIVGDSVVVQMPAIYARQLDDLVLEVELRPLSPRTLEVGSVEVTYHNVVTHAADRFSTSITAEVSDVASTWEESENRDVKVAVIERLANERSRKAVELRDQGKTDEARALLDMNARELRSGATRYKSKTLDKLSIEYSEDSENMDGDSWNRQRKVLQRRNQVSPYQFEMNNF